MAFLATWILGDIFNLVGCIMEPATLPTQFYMAVLYTLTSMALVLQAMYYDYIYPRMKRSKQQQKDPRFNQTGVDVKPRQSRSGVDVIQDYYSDISNKNDTVITSDVLNAPPRLTDYASNTSSGRDLYYVSARSLFKSSTPPLGSYLAQRLASSTSSQTRSSLQDPLLAPQESAEPKSASRVKPMLSVVSAMTFLGALNVHFSALNEKRNPGFVIRVGRRLLQANGGLLQEHGVGEGTGIATFLGWGMAAIYMGGRLPQIFLNMRKGNVEGLNPFMFFFAVVGNSTYVASILVNSMDWSVIRPNLPWLVDAGGCVLLDFFILLQFFYFRYFKPRAEEDNNRYSDTV
ncbi:lysosomal amino acid transporter 1 homolog [Morus notabilis]|uniref:lysosomal amino acid transporter 1 homolog n=1 Tax=Morus notabilis TaxID=981085 RepID=UPI000CED1098|nr:lysosomal amino acid transporter 1 homolog [Morus notabilis]